MTSYLSENEAESPQNCDIHLAQIANFEMGDLESHAFAFSRLTYFLIGVSL